MLQRLLEIVRIVAGVFPCQQMVADMVKVVVPLRIVASRIAGRVSCQKVDKVGIILDDEMDLSAVSVLAASGFRQLDEEMGRAVISNRIDGVESEPVEAIFIQPIERV